MTGIVIVGAGQAGFSVAARLRSQGYKGQLVLIGEEADPPYQRPPLSKKYLMGELARERLYFRPESYYRDNAIDLRLGAAAQAIDREHRALQGDDLTGWSRRSAAGGATAPQSASMPSSDRQCLQARATGPTRSSVFRSCRPAGR